MREMFKGKENAKEFSIKDCDAAQRSVDIVLFFHGTMPLHDKKVCEPQLDLEKAELFTLPKETELYLYGSLEDKFAEIVQNEKLSKEFMVRRI